MLAFLKVRDFALIEELEVEFKEGLNVITGETGAGKSIIINSLSALVTGKVSPDAVRTGARQAEISGQFLDGTGEHILRRTINATGRSRAFVDDEAATINRLEERGGKLVSMYGQNEFQHLLSKESYIAILDNLLGLGDRRKVLSEKVELLRAVRQDLSVRMREAEGKERETSFLEFQVDEIKRGQLKAGEEEQARERIRVLKDVEKIESLLRMITDGFYAGEPSVIGMCKGFLNLLRSFSGMETMEPLKAKLEAVNLDAEEALLEVNRIERFLSYDPEEFQVLEERLSQIYTLKSKYGKTLEDIEQFRLKAQDRLSYLTNLGDEVKRLVREEEGLRREVEEMAEDLSRRRKDEAAGVEAAIIDELSYLSMKGLQFKIAMTDKGSIDGEGRDDVEFMISTNPGEPLKPLRRIASGGELSRIMLAIKKVTGGDEERTLIFDEVDAGIGGRVADMVGKRLKELAVTHQIICITHLPQIAVYGDHHFLVEKYYHGGGTRTGIRELSANERVAEVARMMGSEQITEKARLRAQEMLDHG